jgi:hypothetical protein
MCYKAIIIKTDSIGMKTHQSMEQDRNKPIWLQSTDFNKCVNNTMRKGQSPQ